MGEVEAHQPNYFLDFMRKSRHSEEMKRPNPTLPILEEKDFYAAINKAITEHTRVDQLKMYIGEFEKYKKVFTSVMVPVDPKFLPEVFVFRVEYELKHPVWRIFETLGNQTLDDFARAIIESMNWDNDHMHGFCLPEKHGKSLWYSYSPYQIYAPGWEDDPHPFYTTDNVFVAHLNYEKCPQLGFVFDFGDGHRFRIKYSGKRRWEDGDEPNEMPRLIDQRGVGPEQYRDANF